MALVLDSTQRASVKSVGRALVVGSVANSGIHGELARSTDATCPQTSPSARRLTCPLQMLRAMTLRPVNYFSSRLLPPRTAEKVEMNRTAAKEYELIWRDRRVPRRPIGLLRSKDDLDDRGKAEFLKSNRNIDPSQSGSRQPRVRGRRMQKLSRDVSNPKRPDPLGREGRSGRTATIHSHDLRRCRVALPR